MQFCNNDPIENNLRRITNIDNGEFVFSDTSYKAGFIYTYLSTSIIQKSQLYNFIRDFFVRLVDPDLDKRYLTQDLQEQKKLEEERYVLLLDLFVRKLAEENVKLFYIAVNDELKAFPIINSKISQHTPIVLAKVNANKEIKIGFNFN